MWQEYERDAWLGPAREQMTDIQLAAFDEVAAEIMERWPQSEDDPAAGTDQLNGALMVIMADDTLVGLAAQRQQAQAALNEAHDRVLGAVLARRELGPSEIARQSGLSRVTVTKVLAG